MRTLDSNTVVLDWQRDGVAQGASVATTPRIRNCRGLLPALTIAIAVLLVAVGAGAMVWFDTRGESDEQFLVGLQHSSAATAPVRPPPPFFKSEPSVSPVLEPVTPDVPPALNLTINSYAPARTSSIETGSLPTSQAPFEGKQDAVPLPVHTADEAAQSATPLVPRGRSPVARKVIGTSAANRARNTKWTGTFFDR